jgi:hypothetical protein
MKKNSYAEIACTTSSSGYLSVDPKNKKTKEKKRKKGA